MMFALADCNNFFVSCERVFRPDLQNKPVLVLSGNDGCVVSRSNEVKQLGIKMGAPFFEIKQQVERHGIACFSSNFSLYGDLSARVMSLLSRYTTRLEQYSIDEAFLDFSDVPAEHLRALGEKVRKEVLQGVGIPISIGIAPTRTLAKVASKYAKQYPGYRGVCLIDDDVKRRKALAGFPLADVWGVGRRGMAKLERLQLRTALDFAECSGDLARNILNKPGWQTWCELNGTDCIPVTELPEKRSITRSRTFQTAVTELAVLEKFIADFTVSCAVKLRQQHSVCSQIIVYAETSRFRTDEPQMQLLARQSLPVPTNLTTELLQYALQGLRQHFVAGYKFKRAGVILDMISSDEQVQQSLFDERERPREEMLQKAVDAINSHFGRSAVRMAAQVGVEQEAQLLHADHLSPCYSTNIHDIITLKC